VKPMTLEPEMRAQGALHGESGDVFFSIRILPETPPIQTLEVRGSPSIDRIGRTPYGMGGLIG
jgi:hypothetical protein